jgi:TonB family protein
VTPKAEKAPAPDPKKTAVEKDDPNAFESTSKSKPKANLTPVVRKDATQMAKNTATKSPSNSTAPSKELQALDRTMKNLQAGISTATSVDMPLGPGGGGPTYANFLAAVKKIYMDAWREPNAEEVRDGRTVVVVVIARDGEVLSARITQPSGNPAVDQSVQAALDRVRRAVPLPEGSGSQREVPIGFKVTVKQGTG